MRKNVSWAGLVRLRGAVVCLPALIVCFATIAGPAALGQEAGAGTLEGTGESRLAPHVRARRFLAGRTMLDGAGAAAAMEGARREDLRLGHAGLADAAGMAQPRLNSLNSTWQAVGPAQVASQSYGLVTGRVTAVAIDLADATGNTVYLGTTGGGVWKSVNAAGVAGSVVFKPLTDTLPVYNANAGTAVVPSLSIGAVSVGDGVVLAGTGDPNDASDSYYGAGLLRSADGGVTWTLIQASQDGVAGTHSFVGLGVAGFAWSTVTPALVVAAMSQAAEGTVVNAAGSTSVPGLYYSTDAGVTWQMASILDGAATVQSPRNTGSGNAATAVVWNAARQMFLAAVRFHGYYGSSDGKTWTRLARQPGTGLTAAACPANTGGSGSAGCPIFRGALAVQAATGDTFALTVDAGNLDQGLWQDVCGFSGSACGAASVAFAKQLVSTPLEVGSGSTAIAQADYNLALSAVATGSGASADTLLFAGTEDLYRCSVAGGCALRNTTNAVNTCGTRAMVAPAQHAIATLSGTGTGGLPLVYLGNDGGLWRSVDGVNQQQAACSADDATHFQNLNGGIGSLAEVVSFAQHPTDPATVLAGLGANGVASTATAAAGGAWTQISAGEGGVVVIDPTNPLNWYVSTAAGVSVRFCGKGAACAAADFAGAATIGPAQVADDAALIDAPYLLDPAAMSDVLIGTCRAWRGPAQSGAGWPGSNAISTDLGGPQNAACGAANPDIRSLGAGGPASGATAAQNAGSTVLYAGVAGALDGGGAYGGHVFANYAGGTAGKSTVWTDVAKGTVTNDAVDAGVFNPGGFDVSSMAVDPHDATGRTVYATAMGFAGNGVNAPHVYRTLDGGAHWTNISSNLPNAPANAVLVDPNDANTLYVALDTGVYATTGVATCTSSNCWSVYGAGLPNAPAVTLAAAAGMATGDGRFGELRVGTYGRGIWQAPLLTAASPAGAAISVNPASLTFATEAVAGMSAAQTVTVTNSGNAALTVSQLSVTGDFAARNTCVGTPVAVGGTCAVQVSFLPTAVGTRTGVLTVFGNVAGGQATVALTGVGTTPAAVVLNPIMLTFAQTNVGSISGVENVTVSNTGSVAVNVGGVTVSGDFNTSANTCGASLAPGAGCTVSIAFAPTASGTRTGSFTVTDGAGTQTASLSGVGVLSATDGLAPLSLTFAPQQLNTAGASQAVTLTNSGDAALTLIAATIASGDFTVVNGCGNSLIGHATCSLLVAFVPKSVGPGTGVLTVSDQFRAQTVALSGVGNAPPGVSLSPASTLGFGPLGVGMVSAAQAVTLTNNGGLPLAISAVGTTGDFAIAAGSNTCGASLAAGAACTLRVVFAATAAATRTGVLTVTDNAAGSPQTLTLAGTGVDFALSANGSTTATVSAGTPAVFPLLLTSAAGVPGTVAFTCGPVPAHATCTVTPATPPLGGTTTISVTVATSVLGVWLRMPWERQVVWVAGLLLPLGLVRRRRRRRRGLLLCGLILLGGCGVSRLIPSSGTTAANGATPTPSGTYNLVVTGASAGLVRSVGLTLIVQ